MDCSEFLRRFSEFYDAPASASIRKIAEVHMDECERCANYEQVLSGGIKILRTIPRMDLPESFRFRLQHRLFHIEDGNGVTNGAISSVATALVIAIIVMIIAWSPRALNDTPEVSIPAIIVSDPPKPEALLSNDVWRFLVRAPINLQDGLWSDLNSLLYEYSPMGERYRNSSVSRRTGID